MLTDLDVAWKLAPRDAGSALAALIWGDTAVSTCGEVITAWTCAASAERVCMTEALLWVHIGAELLTTLADVGEENC